MKEYNANQFNIYKEMKKSYESAYGANIGGYIYAGWISYNSYTPYKKLIANSLVSDHGEQRIVVPMENGKGVNCFYKEF